jgi:RNA polymerase sigma-70 factor (ECF subfamily)
MNSETPPERLSQISTMWTALLQRESGTRRDAATAFMERYYPAVYGYLLLCLKDADRAAELFQEFALRYLRGDFHRADPERGRFRDYLRTTLINLVRASHRGTVPLALPHDLSIDDEQPDDTNDLSFLNQWRETILNLVWASLLADEKAGGPPYHTILRARSEQPGETSADLAATLTRELKPEEPFTDANIRKLMQRGREVFSDRVVAEVARSIPSTDPDRVVQELIDLGFYSFCKKAVERWTATVNQ